MHLRHLLPVAALAGATLLPAADFAARWEEIKRTATPRELYSVLYALPKGGDLHNHLVGAFLPEQWYAAATNPELAGRANYYVRLKHGPISLQLVEPSYPFETIRESAWQALPPEDRANFKRLEDLSPGEKEAWISLYKIDQPGEGRYTFFAASPRQRLRHMGEDPVLVPELLVENMKAYGAEGVRYLEFQAPYSTFRAPDGRLLSQEEIVAAYERRLARPDAVATGVEIRFLVTVLRFAPDAEQAVRDTYAFLDTHRDRWVGINMAGIEERNQGYPQRFLDVYREMRRRYFDIGIAIHAGEMDGPNTHVRDTLLLGANRIGHGVTLIKDPDTLLLMRRGPWLVEINLVSNHVLEYVPDPTKHPFPEYLRLGVPVCLNTDDRGWWDSNMTDEHYLAVKNFNLSWPEMIRITRASIEHAFLPAEVKARLLAGYERELLAFERQFGAADWRTGLAGVKPVAYGYAKRQWGLEFP